jgi:hypothetical protein
MPCASWAAVADTTPTDTDWCWATQAADALFAMQNLVTEAIDANADAIDAEALREQVQLYRCAAQIGITSTAARSGTVIPTFLSTPARIRLSRK